MLGCLDWTTFVVGRNVGGCGLVGRVLEVAAPSPAKAALSRRYSIILLVSLLSQMVFSWIASDMMNIRALARVIAVTTVCSNACQLLREETVEILWSKGWSIQRDMFETPPEGPTIVATQYSPSYCLVMFASEMPGGKHYSNRFLCKPKSGILIALLETYYGTFPPI